MMDVLALLDVKSKVWYEALGIAQGQRPDALILEGTWWRREAQASRLGLVSNVRETAFPEMYLGEYGAARIAYCCAYGAARAVEPAHVFAQMGTPLLIQIGTCGALDRELSAGMVMVPNRAGCRDGVSQHYGADRFIDFDRGWNDRARAILSAKGVVAADGLHLTWPSLFAQSDSMCASWAKEGFRSVDMEAASVAAVARRFGVAAITLLSVWDALPDGKTFLDPLDAASGQALQSSNRSVFEVALTLAQEVASQTAS